MPQPPPSYKRHPALQPAGPSPLSVPHFVSPLWGLILDSWDFRRGSLQLPALGNLPPAYLTTDMLITVIYRNYLHLLLITMKLDTSICVPFTPLTRIEHRIPATLPGIGDAKMDMQVR